MCIKRGAYLKLVKPQCYSPQFYKDKLGKILTLGKICEV